MDRTSAIRPLVAQHLAVTPCSCGAPWRDDFTLYDGGETIRVRLSCSTCGKISEGSILIASLEQAQGESLSPSPAVGLATLHARIDTMSSFAELWA
jgi:hypothetical protein